MKLSGITGGLAGGGASALTYGFNSHQYIDIVKDNAIATELSGNGGNIYDVLFGNEGNVEEILDDSLEDYITEW